MAKEKKKDGKKAKRAKPQKAAVATGAQQAEAGFPREIAGVKVPRKLRDAAEQLRDLAKNPVAQDIATDLAAAALMAAAAKIADSKPARKAASDVADDVEDAAEDGARKTAQAGDAMKMALLNAARTILTNVDLGPRKPKA